MFSWLFVALLLLLQLQINIDMNVKKHISSFLSIFCICLLFSCSEESALVELDNIKNIGDKNPNIALSMLDSLELEMRSETAYVKHKYDLLRIRLNDKADNIPNSDIIIKNLMSYFESNGSIRDKQEVFYYAGSVYRDLQDTPHALEYFFKSLDYVDSNECDSVLLRNTYSNLHFLQYRVQNYKEAAKMAEKEYEVCKMLGMDEVLPYMHVGSSYLALDSIDKAQIAFDSALSLIVKSKNRSQYQNSLIYLLGDYSELKEISKAQRCISLIDKSLLKEFSAVLYMSFAQYYEASGDDDSAIIYCKRILDDGTDINNLYDASKLLYRIYKKKGKVDDACKYADIYMNLSDSIDFGKRQELAATVNNEFQYHLDQRKEQSLNKEINKYKNTLILVFLIVILIVCAIYVLYVHKRNKNLQNIIALSSELQRISDDDKKLRVDIEQKEKELEKSKEELGNYSAELNKVKTELQRVNDELSSYDAALSTKERELSDKIQQNKNIIRLLHQSKMEENAEEVIRNIKESAVGKKEMKLADWKRLYKAVDELYPLFKDSLIKELGSFNEQQMQVCYLMRIGLSKNQIQNLTGLSRVTIWRWTKKYEWILL